MKTKRCRWLAGMATLLFLVQTAAGADAEKPAPTLKIGSPAPKLQTGKWIQGEPVTAFDTNKAYLVEFWATWCGPCKVSIPHLNDLHNKYKDKGLVVIGQNCWENNESAVEPFVKAMGDKMTYRVVLDNKEGSKMGKMAETWMQAAGRDGIPSAFLVDKAGKTAWIGHPMELKESVIEQVLAGSYDLEKAIAEAEQQSRNEVKLRELSDKLQKQMQAREWEQVDATLNEVEKLLPEAQRPGVDLARFNVLLTRGKVSEAAELAGRLSVAQKDSPMLQNQLAWELAIHEDATDREYAIAEQIALRANEASKGQEPAILDTVARLMFLRGKKEEAIAMQEKAVKLAEGPLKANLEASLKSYREGKLPDVEP